MILGWEQRSSAFCRFRTYKVVDYDEHLPYAMENPNQDKPHHHKKSLSGGGTAYQDVGVIMGLIVVGYQVMHVWLIKGDSAGWQVKFNR